MKKVKLFLAMALLCGGAYAGYTAYENATMTDAERLMKQNLEALTEPEITIPFICVGDEGDCATINGQPLFGERHDF